MPQRPYRPRGQRQIALIQCEGRRTEYTYLDEFCRDCGIRHVLTVDVNPGKGQNAVVTVQTALDKAKTERARGKIYDEIWCVLDVENAAHETTLNDALALAKQHGIRVCLSNPSFEVWLLAHFERVTRSFENSSAVEHRLEEAYWRRHFGGGYDKGDQNLYDKLKSRLPDALANSQRVLETFHENKPCRECNASTEVYRLIQRLLPPIVESGKDAEDAEE